LICNIGERVKKKQTVLERLKAFFEKYFGLGIDSFGDEYDKTSYENTESQLKLAAEEQELLGE
jgi:type I restriction enzyme R subunit